MVSGLGTPNTIFQKFLELASKLDINVAVSAESVGTDHEFIRYDKGMPWERFHNRLKKLDEYNINYEFFNLADMADTPKKRIHSLSNIISNEPNIVIYGLDIANFRVEHFYQIRNNKSINMNIFGRN